MAVYSGNPHAGNGTGKVNIRNRQGRRGTNHGQHVRIVFLIHGQYRGDHLGFIPPLFRKQGTNRAIDEAGRLPRERTAVLMGMQCDAEVARYGARWRTAQWRRDVDEGETLDDHWLTKSRDAFCPALDAPAVVGTMPNIVANRLNSQFDLAGPSLTVSSEEASGVVAVPPPITDEEVESQFVIQSLRRERSLIQSGQFPLDAARRRAWALQLAALRETAAQPDLPERDRQLAERIAERFAELMNLEERD